MYALSVHKKQDDTADENSDRSGSSSSSSGGSSSRSSSELRLFTEEELQVRKSLHRYMTRI